MISFMRNLDFMCSNNSGAEINPMNKYTKISAFVTQLFNNSGSNSRSRDRFSYIANPILARLGHGDEVVNAHSCAASIWYGRLDV